LRFQPIEFTGVFSLVINLNRLLKKA
jgi:hypothetical protein